MQPGSHAAFNMTLVRLLYGTKLKPGSALLEQTMERVKVKEQIISIIIPLNKDKHEQVF